MITSLEEVLQIKKLLTKAKNELRSKNILFENKTKIGIMIEVPSAVLIANALAKEVDFFSIGTNDLVQYILAVARDSNLVSDMYQIFHPAVLRAIDVLVKSAERNNIELSVCGEMAGDVLGSLLLIGLGVNDLSVETTSYLRVKKLIRSISYSHAQEIASKVLTFDTETEIREYLTKSFGKSIKDNQPVN